MIISNIATGQGDEDKRGCLLQFNYIKNYCKMIAIDLNTQQELGADSITIQQVFRNLAQGAGETLFFIIEEAK